MHGQNHIKKACLSTIYKSPQYTQF